MDKFLRALPPEEYKVVNMQSPGTPKAMVEALECALTTLAISEQQEGRQFFPSPHWDNPIWYLSCLCLYF